MIKLANYSNTIYCINTKVGINNTFNNNTKPIKFQNFLLKILKVILKT